MPEHGLLKLKQIMLLAFLFFRIFFMRTAAGCADGVRERLP
jgi:hypothetical protein